MKTERQLSGWLRKNSNAFASYILSLEPSARDSVLKAIDHLEEHPLESKTQVSRDSSQDHYHLAHTAIALDLQEDAPWDLSQLPEDYRELVNTICRAAHEVYSNLGRGYLEGIYREAMVTELRSAGIPCQVEVFQSIQYKNTHLSYGAGRIDILVNGNFVIELKADTCSTLTCQKADEQCARYLRQGHFPCGMSIGFPDKRGKPLYASFIQAYDHVPNQ